MLRISLISLFIIAQLLYGNILTGQGRDNSGRTLNINTITTSVPFLTIPPDSYANGWITTVPNGTLGSGIYGNLGLLALDSSLIKATVEYTPWLRKLIPDINLLGTGASFRLSRKETIGFNLIYFSLGEVTFHDDTGQKTMQFNPNEFAFTVFNTYNIDALTGIGVGFKFIYSNLTGGANIQGIDSHPGMSFAVDLGFAKQFKSPKGYVDHFLGVSLTNIGSKISYTSNSDKDFIPITLKTGYGIRVNFPYWNSITLSYECEKLLVPSPPLYYRDSVDPQGMPIIQSGLNPDVSIFKGMIQSFYDAPGGSQEELNELTHLFGMLYRYRFFSLGASYFLEHPTKGNRRFITLGCSAAFRISRHNSTRVGFNFSYLIPVNNQQSPLANTICIGTNISF